MALCRMSEEKSHNGIFLLIMVANDKFQSQRWGKSGNGDKFMIYIVISVTEDTDWFESTS